MSLLIVAEDRYGVVGLVEHAKKIGILDVILCNHQEARKIFESKHPEHVIVFDYVEPWSLEGQRPGFKTWRELNALRVRERVIRCGWNRYSYPDYLRLPFVIDELTKLLLA